MSLQRIFFLSLAIIPFFTFSVSAANNAQFISQSVPSNMTPGAVYAVSVSLKNTGTTTWTAAGKYRLGSQNPRDGLTWALNRVYLSSGESIAPGQSKTFYFNVTAPTTTGIYNFQWRMVQDAVEWFGEYSQNVPVNDGVKIFFGIYTGGGSGLPGDQVSLDRFESDVGKQASVYGTVTWWYIFS
jgi:hypothetical protein